MNALEPVGPIKYDAIGLLELGRTALNTKQKPYSPLPAASLARDAGSMRMRTATGIVGNRRYGDQRYNDPTQGAHAGVDTLSTLDT